MQLGNGRWETAEYNNRGQITEIGLGTTDSTQNLLMLELDYGTNTQNNGSLREQTITVPTIGGTSGFTAIQTYTYDDLNRIQSATEMIGVTETWKQTFTIDRYGNRRFNTTSNLTTTLGSCTEAVCNPTISTANNRFTSDGYDYDENGNLIEDAQGQRFIYDAENHQTGYFDASNSGSTPDATYTYDGEGKRVIKISSTETTVFVYNASGQLVAEYSTQISQTPQVSYLTADHLGSPRVITDQDGNVTSRKDYTAFGEENITSEREPELGYLGQSETRKGYTGYEKDNESGLDFAQARYYNSTHGRFTSVDPLTASASIRNPQTFNRYSYVLNSPYKYVDPLGLNPEEECRTCSASDLSTQSIDEHQAEEEKRRKKEREERRKAKALRRQQAASPRPPSAAPKTNSPNPQQGEFGAIFVTGNIFITNESRGNQLAQNVPSQIPLVSGAYTETVYKLNITMQIRDNEGNALENYEYESSSNGNELGAERRQAIDGEAHVSLSPVFTTRNQNDLNIPEDNARTFTGTVTIYREGARYAKAGFSVSTKGNTVSDVSPAVRLEWMLLP